MDVQYRISADAVSGSVLANPPLPSDSKALRSESDIFATSTIGSCGVDPGPVVLLSMSAAPKGEWLNSEGKRLVPSSLRSFMFSAFAMQYFTVVALRGGGTDITSIRPTKALLGVTGVFEGMAPSSV